MIPVVDRVPTYPNRIKLTYANGDTEYVTWERADEPTVEGTPLNKALFDSIAADIGMATDTELYVSSAGSDTLNDGSVSLPFATITKALSTLPKNLNGCDATIRIASGTYNEVVEFNGYYGGNIVLAGSESNTAITVNGIKLLDAAAVSVGSTATITVGTSGIVVGNNSCLTVHGSISVSGAAYGVHADGHARFTCTGTLTVNNATEAAVHATGGWIQLATLAGSGNAVGVSAQRGGLVAYTTNSASATTATYTAGGGRIYAGAQAGAIKTTDIADKSVTKAKLASDVTAGALGGATLDSNKKVTADQASADIVTLSASATLALTHAGKFVWASSSNAITLTVPANSSVAFPIDTEIEIIQAGTGAVKFAAASGVTIMSLDSSKTIAGRYGCVCLKKVNTDNWVLGGALE